MKNRSRKKLIIFMLMSSIACLSIGFAAFSTTLDISSQASVTPNSDTFIVKFSTNQNSMVTGPVTPSSKTAGVISTDGIIDNSTNPTLTNLSATFTSPGQYVEYTVYARNEGEYTAYLNSINYFREKTCTAGEGVSQSLVDEACSGINVTTYVEGVEYSNTTQITGHYLAKKTSEEIKIRISYDSTATAIAEEFSIIFSDIVMVYSTIDDSSFVPTDSPLNYRLLSDIIKEGAVSDQKYNSSVIQNNLMFIINSTINDANPIYYYYGSITKNNVRFANFCWKIVRTTDTGGIKLIYNGIPADNGSCNNTGTASQISNSVFNSISNSPAYVGYMYGSIYTLTEKTLYGQTETYIYGNDVVWDGTNYTLTDTMASSKWSSDYTNLAKKYHYTCFNETGICDTVYYIHNFSNSSTLKYFTLSGGKNIEKIKEEMFTNTTDSDIKTKIDSWYSTNMTNYTYMLEDTVWCNDRTLYDGTLASKDISGISSSRFSAYERELYGPISITCSNIRDSFTVSSAIGNGKLTYPVGLLTSDELNLAGYNNSSYLNHGKAQWSMSPETFSGSASMFGTSNYYVTGILAGNSGGVRPAISLKPSAYVSTGDGSADTPYVIE